MKILSVVGARPNFMKIAPIIFAIMEHNSTVKKSGEKIRHVLLHTGQHYDKRMSELFFNDLGIPKPDYNLGVRSGSHAYQTAEIMKRFEATVVKERPNYVLVVGDVNSTIACTLVSKKLGIKVIHVEAGLRSFDMTMPEEINRVLTDAISDILFITEEDAKINLLREGIPKEKVYFVGNVMIDTLLNNTKKAQKSEIISKLGLLVNRAHTSSHSKVMPYTVLTLHRPANVDDPLILKEILQTMNEISRHVVIVFPVHPRTRGQIKKTGVKLNEKVQLISPLGYLDFLKLMSSAKFVMTDSGGIQEETTVLGIPCLTMRNNTERPVTIKEGTNKIVGLDSEIIIKESINILKGSCKRKKRPKLWDGKAAKRIVTVLMNQKVTVNRHAKNK